MLMTVMVAAPSLAADIDEVARVVFDDGYYVEQGSNASESRISELVGEARGQGSRLMLVALSEEPNGGATTFAGAVFDRLGIDGLVVVVAPDSVGFEGEGDIFTAAEVNAALDAALDAGGNDTTLFTNFVHSLPGLAVVGTGTTAASGSGGGGGGGGFFLFLLIAAAVVLLVVWFVRRSKKSRKPRDDSRIAQARHVVQKQLDAVANDILAMEDEVRVADNNRADDFYQTASQTYSAVIESFEDAHDPQPLIALSVRLDEAIWQLDAAEAILDGKPVPPKPEPPSPVILDRPAPQSRAPAPGYGRRSTRRSSPIGPGMMDLLIGVAGSVLAGSGRRSRGSGGGLFGGRRTSRTTRSSRSSRSSPIPGPGSRGRSNSPPRKTTRQRTGRIRGGRKRRR